jgi:hypothetical protein
MFLITVSQLMNCDECWRAKESFKSSAAMISSESSDVSLGALTLMAWVLGLNVTVASISLFPLEKIRRKLGLSPSVAAE